MPEKEIIQKNIEEFSRLQTYMLAIEKDSNGYKLMKEPLYRIESHLKFFWHQSFRNRQNQGMSPTTE